MFNYWIPATLKLFPQLLNVLVEQLTNGASCIDLFSLISLLKLGRKESRSLSVWNETFKVGSLTLEHFSDIVESALEHPDEMIRSEAFAVVCCSTKATVTPSGVEFRLVQDFLLHNVNIDNALLRQSIINSFRLFLKRALQSSSFQMEQNITTNTNFLEWLYYFLFSNLEPGVNYQRKILSLQLIRIVLSCFGGAGKARWHFDCVRSCKTLLSCVLDPTDDVREVAASVLIQHFSLQKETLHEFDRLLEFALNLCASQIFYETESGVLLLNVIASWVYRLPEELSGKFVSKVAEEIYGSETMLMVTLFQVTKQSSIQVPATVDVTSLHETSSSSKQDSSARHDFSVSSGYKSIIRQENENSVSVGNEERTHKRAATVSKCAGEQTGAPLSVFLLSRAEKELSNLKNDIFQAITTGSPLHGTLGALARLSTHAGGPEFGCMSAAEVDRTVSLLEEAVSYLLSLLSEKSSSHKGKNSLTPKY